MFANSIFASVFTDSHKIPLSSPRRSQQHKCPNASLPVSSPSLERRKEGASMRENGCGGGGVVVIVGTGMDSQDTSPSVLLFFDEQRFIYSAGEINIVYSPKVNLPGS
ncbi:unnamed protein product [Linum tenue]|uniref:Uncharacterized protein n=1 Tax=Linum tenue TaxID=586396 RepID=A0AAV0KLR8_9ROSI|nr:unnamed protein product [Linum tenue]